MTVTMASTNAAMAVKFCIWNIDQIVRVTAWIKYDTLTRDITYGDRADARPTDIGETRACEHGDNEGRRGCVENEKSWINS